MRRGGREEPQALADDRVEVRERVQFIHRGGVGVEIEKLLAELALYIRRLRERVEAPCRRGARRLVAGDYERRNLCFSSPNTAYKKIRN